MALLEKINKFKKNKPLIILILILVGVAIYANCLPNEMFWDDDDFILNNRYIKDWQYLPKYFSESLLSGAQLINNYWRPLLLMIFSLEWHLWKDWAPGYHMVSILFHTATGVLLFLFLQKLFRKTWLAFFSSLIFIIHPLQTEAVVYPNAMGDSLASFFMLCSLIFFLKAKEKTKKQRRYIILSISMYVCGLLSKETAFMLPGLIMAVNFIKQEDNLPIKQKTINTAKVVLPYLAIAFIYFILRATVLNFSNSFNFYDTQNAFSSDILVRLLTFFHTLTIYAQLLFLPLDLRVERSVPFAQTFFSFPVILGALLFTLLIFLMVRNFQKDKIISFGIFWFFVCLFPMSNIVIPINAPLYEHFLYLPMVGILLVVINKADILIQYQPKLKKPLICLAIAFACFFSGRTIMRNLDWRTAINFYEKLLPHAPNYRVINNLGMEYADKGFIEKAIPMYKKAITLMPKNPVAYHNLGNSYRAKKKYDKAISYLQKAIEIDPNFLFSLKPLAQIYLDQKDYARSRAVLEKYYHLSFEKVETLKLLTQIAARENNYSALLQYLETILLHQPNDKQTKNAIIKLKGFLSSRETSNK